MVTQKKGKVAIDHTQRVIILNEYCFCAPFKKPLNCLILFDIRRYHLTCQIRVQGIAVLD